MAISTVDGIVAALPGQAKPFFRVFSPQASGSYASLWLLSGQPGPGVAPSSGVAGDVPTSATAGCIPFSNPGGGALSYLAGAAVYSSGASGMLLLYDRLWQNSGLSVTSTSGQTVQSSSPAVPLTRPDANGADVEAWWECETAMGAGAPTSITITYTNQAGTTGRTGTLQNVVASAAVGRSFRFALQSGDTGVRSIQTYTSNLSMTSGTFALVLRRRIAAIPIGVAAASVAMDAIALGMPQIYDSACLELIWLANTTTATQVGGLLTIAQG